MKVEQQKAGDCRIKLVINVGAEDARPDYEKIVGEYVAHARLPGFRPGKAPRAVILRRFERELDEDVRRALIARFHRQAIEQEKLDVVNIVDVSDVLFSVETGISFVLTVDVAPVFKLPKYHKIPLKVNAVEVTEPQIDEQVNVLRRSMTRYEAADAPVAAGDMAQIDYTATTDGKPLGEVYPDSGRFAAATGFWTHAAEPSFIPGLVDVLIGMKAGDNRALAVKFPKDFALESLRGVKAAYSLTVQAVRAALPPDDGELVKQVGIESMDELRRRLRENLEQEAARAEEQRQRQEISDYLLKKADFPLPQSVVAQETQRVLRQMLGEIGQRPGASEFVEKNRETLLSNASQAATTRVRLSTILGAIAAAEKIEATEAEVNAELAAAASYYASRGEKDMTPAKLRERMEESGGLQQVAHEIRDGKVMKWLLDDAKA